MLLKHGCSLSSGAGAVFALALGCAGADPSPTPPTPVEGPAEQSEPTEPGPVMDAEHSAMLQSKIDAFHRHFPEVPLDLQRLRDLMSSNEPITFAAVGASTEADRPPSGGVEALDAELVGRAEQLGFREVDLVVNQGWVVAEGDTLLDPEVLRSGGYVSTVEKGYKHGNIVNSTNDGNIKLAMEPFFQGNSEAVLAAWLAASDWSWGNSISINLGNTGPSITMRPRVNPPCDGEALACAPFPIDGRPGSSVYFRIHISGVTEGSCSWTFPLLLLTASHEMGHAIGFAHPTPLEGTHISGTEPCAWPLGLAFLCKADPLYPTVMSYANFNDETCAVGSPSLAEDDFLSSAELY